MASRNRRNHISQRRFTPVVGALLFAAQGCSTPPEDPAETSTFDLTSIEEVVDAGGASMGSVVFPVSCNEEAGARMRLGLALLHNMTYVEAERVFESAANVDPGCALAPWGMAMTYLHPLWPDVPSAEQFDRGWALLQEARKRGLETDREAGYVRALEAYYRDAADRTELERLRTYDEAWRGVSTENPADPEAALFSALAKVAVGRGDPTFAPRIEAGTMAERVLQSIPDHPGAHHYVIHAFDVPPLAERALPVARSYGEVAPENSHALHMTSHIFTRAGLWEESIEYNERAAEVALAEPIDGRTSHHHLHAVDYLAYAHLQRGGDEEAEAVLEHVQMLGGPAADNSVSAYALAAVPARLALERRRWTEAAALEARHPSTITWDRYPHLEAITVFANALGAAHMGDLASAERSADRLASLASEAAALPETYDWATQVRIQEVAARAWIAYAGGASNAAVDLMREAVALEATTQKNPVTPGEVLPAGELLGDMLAGLGRHEEALAAYESALERSANRFNSLLGAGAAAEALGRGEVAAKYYRELLGVAGSSQTRRPVIERLEAFLEDR